MATQINEFCGFKSIGARPRSLTGLPVSSNKTPVRVARTRLTVESFKRTFKKKQLVLLEDVEKVGKRGELVTVAMGYWRNYLAPYRKAKAATENVLAAIRAEEEAVERRKAEIKAKAMRLAVALKTIGKFTITKKAGDGGVLFGSVTRQNIVDAIYQQTGQEIETRDVTIPEIRELGSFEVSVKLHPEVVGFFKIVVERQKNIPGQRARRDS